LVREGAFENADALAGKSVLAVAPQDPGFISKIALDSKPSLGSSVTLSFTSRALKAVRKLAKGKVDAALVDQDAVAFLPELNLPTKLVSLHTSSGLPGLTMSSVRGQAAPDIVAKVKSALPKLCQGEGASLCKNFKVAAFEPAKISLYKRLLKRYKGQ
jgi:ABC-type phosphate/phosphonate transport system substrate-binding protein